MKKIISLQIVFLVWWLMPISVHAIFVDRGGGLIYDTDLNITWFQDTNYAKTSGYHSSRDMPWNEAIDYINYLNTNNFLNYNDWRLPHILPSNSSGLAWNFHFGMDLQNAVGDIYYPWAARAGDVSPLNYLPDLFVTLNRDFQTSIFGGFGTISPNGNVAEIYRMTQTEAGNSYSPFGITVNSSGEYWTSNVSRLIRFDPITGVIIQSFTKINHPFLHLVFAPDDRLIGWSNNDGFLYEIFLEENTYIEIPLVFIGLHSGGLTEMAYSPNGELFGIDNRNKRLIQIDTESGVLTTIRQFSFGSFLGLVVAPNGTIFTTDSISRTIFQLDTSGNELWRASYSSDSPITGLEFSRAVSIYNGLGPGETYSSPSSRSATSLPSANYD